MPRRRSSKGNSKPVRSKKGSSVQKWNTRDDIEFDEVDQFHEQRDKILLEGEEEAQDSDYNDDEVFALEGLAESSEDDDDDDERSREEPDEVQKPEPQKKSKGREEKKATTKNKIAAESSEESSEEEEDEESWGLKKAAYYSSNAAYIDSDDEEAHEMEEQEAHRLQSKLRMLMREEDFGYSEALQSTEDLKPVDDIWKAQEQIVPVATGTDKVSILRHLEKTSPETLALAFEWEDIARSVVKTTKRINKTVDDKEDKALGLIHTHHQTLLTYAAVLAFYLHLRASAKYAARPELLRQHPVLKRLYTLKKALNMFEELNFAMSDSEDSDDSDGSKDFESEDESLDGDLGELDTWIATRKRGLDAGELEDLLSEANAPARKLPKVKLNVNPKAEVGRQPAKKKRKVSDGATIPKVRFDVEEPTFPKGKGSSPSASTKKSGMAKSFGFGEATSLDEADIADKKGRRKALRFHTAKIESASARRQGARNALGGDDDVPYRGRVKEKQKRSSLGAGGADLDDAEPQPREPPAKRGRDEDSDSESGSDDDDDGYYSLVKRQKKLKKAKKKAQHDAATDANRFDSEEDATPGQRSVTRAILANKGLTPKRSKSVRNPRVKKRQKFEKAKKKLSSQKAIYKGGIGDPSHYGGEMSGISKVIKSVKL